LIIGFQVLSWFLPEIGELQNSISSVIIKTLFFHFITGEEQIFGTYRHFKAPERTGGNSNPGPLKGMQEMENHNAC